VRSKWVVIPFFVAHGEGCIQALRDSRLQAYSYEFSDNSWSLANVTVVPALGLYNGITVPRIFLGSGPFMHLIGIF
jgi:hypothetical protein